MFNISRFLLHFLLLFSGSVFAADVVFWNVSMTGYQSIYTSDPSSYCIPKLLSYPNVVSADLYLQEHDRLTFMGYGPTGGFYVSCLAEKPKLCIPNHVYNSGTGECVPLPPEPESFEFLFCYNYDGGDGCASGTNKGRPDSFCKNGVVFSADYNPSTTDASCYSYRNGDGTSGPAIMCSVTGTPTKQSCNTDYKTDTPDNSCPAGTVGGEFNNKRVCVPSSTGGGSGDGGKDGDNSGDGGTDGDGSGGETGGDGDGNGSDGDGDGTGSGGNSGGGNNGGGGSNGGGDGNGDGNGTGDGSGNGSGDGEGEGEEEGTGSGQGVELCESGRCEFGDEKSDFFGGEVRTYSESMSAIFEGMQNSPLSSAISNIKFPEGGTCPTGSTSIDIGIGVIPLTFTEHCNFWEQISPVLSAAFLALWSVIAVRVFLSA